MDAVHAGGLGGTYGGNPVACAAALGSIATMKQHDLGARAREIGDLMRDAAARARRAAPGHRRHPRPRRDDGHRAVRARHHRLPTPPAAAAVNAYCHQHGVVTLTCGTYGNVFRFLPPLSIGDDLLHEAFDVVAEALDATA